MTRQHDDTGGVIWISGYSAAGKTTVGRHLNRLLLADGHASVFLDGDQLRSIFSNKWGYETQDRIELACTYFRLCSHLSKQGVFVVISAVAMFDEARQWFSDNVENGLEVYLRVPLDVRIVRDEKTKGIYKNLLSDMNSYTEPKEPGLVIDNYGDMSCEEAAKLIFHSFMLKQHGDITDYGRTDYWSNFYAARKAVSSPTPFAMHCIQFFTPGQRILEIGCGNGRDASYFSDNGFPIVALDKSAAAISDCMKTIVNDNAVFICGEAKDVLKKPGDNFDIVYCRFSLHAMTEKEENSALDSANALLNPGGLICIECRSINDPMARKGEVLSPSERIDGHYRRFIIREELESKLTTLGLTIIQMIESNGLAVFKDEDPVVIRVIAKKQLALAVTSPEKEAGPKNSTPHDQR